MKRLIGIRCGYTLARRDIGLVGSSDDKEHVIIGGIPSCERSVSISIRFQEGVITAWLDQIEIEDRFIVEMASLHRLDGHKLSAGCRDFIVPIVTQVRDLARNVVALIRYHLRHFDVSEQLISGASEQWTEDGREFHDVPGTPRTIFDNFSHMPFNERATAAVQASLTSGITPLLAMRHLHRAKNEGIARHKWIDATTAAELAIKEVLCRANSDIAPLLLELPSPPMAKLYGSIMKRYLGRESPYRSELVKGQELRNRLVHRVGEEQIDAQDANSYVSMVEMAIFDLLELLYPDDLLIRWAGPVQRRAKAAP